MSRHRYTQTLNGERPATMDVSIGAADIVDNSQAHVKNYKSFEAANRLPIAIRNELRLTIDIAATLLFLSSCVQ